MITRTLIKCSMAVAVLALWIGQAQANTFSITDDFSATANPNGAWSYGWLNGLGGTFTGYTAPLSATAGGTVQSWHDPATYSLGAPSVWNNSSISAYITGTVNYSAGWAGFHPGYQNQMSDFRFMAQTAGTYAVAFDFQGADVVGTTSDVHVYTGGNDIFSANIFGYGDSTRKSFSSMLFLNAGQTIDIAVGYGSNGSYFYDSTAVRGTIATVPVIAAVPEPETYAMMLAGLGLLGTVARRRKQKLAA